MGIRQMIAAPVNVAMFARDGNRSGPGTSNDEKSEPALRSELGVDASPLGAGLAQDNERERPDAFAPGRSRRDCVPTGGVPARAG